MKKIINERTTSTKEKSLKRIYLNGKYFFNTKFGIGTKISYEMDFSNKKIRIIPTNDNVKGTVSKKKRKYKGKEELIPVIDINNKNIEKLFSGINKCKVYVYEDEILIEPLEKVNNVISILSRNKKSIYRISNEELDYLACNRASGDTNSVSLGAFSIIGDKKDKEQFNKDSPKLLKVLSLFSGIGAFEEALKNINVNFEITNYCEFKPFIAKSYSIIHKIKEKFNLGDITKVNEKSLEPFDLMTYGFPCQDISQLGKRKGLFNKDGSLTRSGLFYEAMRIAKYNQPKYMIGENVASFTYKPYKLEFEGALQKLDEIGYNTYYKVLNSKDYGIPHSRGRVFFISVRKDIDNGKFKFPEPMPLTTKASDYYDTGELDDEYYLNESQYKYFSESKLKKQYSSINADVIICMNTKQGRKSNPQNFVKDSKGYRILTEGEMFSLQGFKRKYGKLLRKFGIKLHQIGYMCGNSITVNVVEEIFKKLLPKKYYNAIPIF